MALNMVSAEEALESGMVRVSLCAQGAAEVAVLPTTKCVFLAGPTQGEKCIISSASARADTAYCPGLT